MRKINLNSDRYTEKDLQGSGRMCLGKAYFSIAFGLHHRQNIPLQLGVAQFVDEWNDSPFLKYRSVFGLHELKNANTSTNFVRLYLLLKRPDY